MKKILIIACLILTACGKPKAKDVPQEKTGGDVGPYDLVLSGETESKPNAFSASINQEDGKVDFYLPNGAAAQYLVLHSFNAQVVGCNANGVQAVPVWYASESDAQGELVAAGSTLMTSMNTRSLLRMVFRGMKGCTQLNFSMVVRKLEVGALQPSLETALAGMWTHQAPGNHQINLLPGSSALGWLESRGTTYTCDRTFYPASSIFPNGGWLVFSGASMICKYSFANATKREMDMNCWGTNTWGCTVPQNSRFIKN